MREMVEKYGGGYIYAHYPDICKELLTQKASQRGYALARWAAYLCGEGKNMTHYAAVLEQ